MQNTKKQNNEIHRAYIGYALAGSSFVTGFSVVFAFIAGIVKLSGLRSGFLALGAALGPLLVSNSSMLYVYTIL